MIKIYTQKNLKTVARERERERERERRGERERKIERIEVTRANAVRERKHTRGK